MIRLNWQRYAFLALLPLGAACGSSVRSAQVALTPSRPLPVSNGLAAPIPTTTRILTPVAAPEDPVPALLSQADAHFESGQKELALGHVDGARVEFNHALHVLIASPFGGRTEPRIREHFDRLVDRISVVELKALTEGDGFTEKPTEGASLDELLALSSTFIAPPTPGLQGKVEADLATVAHDVPVPLNQRVLAYVELFQGRLHDFIDDGMRRGSKYLPMIQNVFRAEGLPLDLAYIPLIESAFKPNALSRAKARGVWQFMAGTALENGLRRDWYIDERSDPEKATLAAAKYLGTLGKLFNGDWHLAIASYNGGPGRLQKAMKKGQMDNFWDLASNPRLLPRETREYVPMILAAIVIARNPAQYGFSVPADPPHAYDTVHLSRPVDLRRVAEWAHTNVQAIQTLNPELRRWTTPVREKQYQLKVPAGAGALVQARLDEAPHAELASLRYYVVTKGENLAQVARKLSVSKSDLAEANYLSVKGRVAVGQRLIVPREATVLMAARTDRAAPPAGKTERTAQLAEARPTVSHTGALAKAANSDRTKVIYEVKSGDTLFSIARLFRTSVASIKTWNGIRGNTVIAGTRLTVYRAAS